MTKAAPLWFWIAAILGTLWDAMGCYVYWSEVTMSPATLASLQAYQADLIANRPIWSTIGFAIGTWGGLLGMILLLLRQRLAVPVLLIAAIAVLIAYVWPIVSGHIANFQPADWILFLLIPILQILLWLLGRKARAARWIA